MAKWVLSQQCKVGSIYGNQLMSFIQYTEKGKCNLCYTAFHWRVKTTYTFFSRDSNHTKIDNIP